MYIKTIEGKTKINYRIGVEMKIVLSLLICILAISCSSDPDVSLNGATDDPETDIEKTPFTMYVTLPDSVRSNETLEENGYGVYTTIREVLSGERDVYEMVYLTDESIMDSIAVEEPKDIEETGKIYHFKNYMLVSEPNKGIHVFDNITPTDPQAISFIKIPYGKELAMRDSVLYVDCFDNLVAIVTEDFRSIDIVKQENLFYNSDAHSELQYQAWSKHFDGKDSYDYRILYQNETFNQTENDISNDADEVIMTNDDGYMPYTQPIIVDYRKVGRESYSDTIYDYHYTENRYKYYENTIDYADVSEEADMVSDSTIVGSDAPTTGTGGSMAKFTIQGDYLYVINQADVQLFDISEVDNPTKWTKVSLSWDIETLYPFDDKIFVGSMSGMYILDTEDKGNPVLAGVISHVTSCDPVVADDKYAYVTLRGGSMCGGYTNQLDVIDISDIYNPELIKTYSMQGPKGLAIDGDVLYVCDGEAGMKVYNVEDPMQASLISWIRDIDTYDVIVVDDEVTLVSADGVRVYNSEDPSELEELSYIEKK